MVSVARTPRPLRWVVLVLLVLVVLASGALLLFFRRISATLPDYECLKRYQPRVLTRLYASDGCVLSELVEQRRFFTPFQRIPSRLVQAFLAAEDKNFYKHRGVDFASILRAAVIDGLNIVKGGDRRPIGASTITQQVAKNFFLTGELSLKRKLKEAILAYRLERTLSKERILELYLNQIYLGNGSYGVASAAATYFGLSIDQLSLSQMAYLAALPKAPNNYHPVRDHRRSVARRNWVLERMYEVGFIQGGEMREAQREPLTAPPPPEGRALKRTSGYFIQEVEKELRERYGDRLLTSGLTVHTTIDPQLQRYARQALREGILAYDRQRSYRGPVTHLPYTPSEETAWVKKLADLARNVGDDEWKLAIVTGVSQKGAPPGWVDVVTEDGVRGPLRAAWGAVQESIQLRVGDVVYVSDPGAHPNSSIAVPVRPTFQLEQMPEVNGAIVVMDPYTGRVLALQGGFSFASSQFNRATRAFRQPGSALKPIIFAAALEKGFTPASLVADMPVSVGRGGSQALDWRPRDYEKSFLGYIRLRDALEKSRNLATVHLAQELGMRTTVEYVGRFGVQEKMPSLPSMILGAGSTTLMRLSSAYCVFANGGLMVHPLFIDRIQDMTGKIIYRSDERLCPACRAPWEGQVPPKLERVNRRVISAQTAYQVTSMLEGAVEHGTGRAAYVATLPIAGKTGTTNREKDAWFVGYSSTLLVGVFVGYDIPRPMGRGKTGGRLAAPIFRSFMEKACASRAGVPFHVPDDIRFIKINKKTGEAVGPSDVPASDVMFEVFKGGDRLNGHLSSSQAVRESERIGWSGGTY